MADNENSKSEAVPTEWLSWGESIELTPGVLYRRWIGGPNGEEWRPEPDEKD